MARSEGLEPPKPDTFIFKKINNQYVAKIFLDLIGVHPRHFNVNRYLHAIMKICLSHINAHFHEYNGTIKYSNYAVTDHLPILFQPCRTGRSRIGGKR
ncbi:hypothetical protein FOLKNPGA_02491 [Legionella sp. PC1000]|nr:hypothetical protein FOLKNPGA_02491 [Legionella sp. PC1000]